MVLGCVIHLSNRLLCKEVFANMKGLTQKNKAEFIVIRGFFDEKDNISVSPLYTGGDERLDAPEDYGPYTVEIRDATGSLLASYAFKTGLLTVIKADSSERQIDSRQFAFEIPFDDRTQKVVMKKGPTALWSVTRSPHAPVVSIKQPKEGVTIKGKINLEWTGSDADGDTLHYLIEYSKDKGLTWEPVTGLLKEPKLRLDTTTLSPALSAILAIVCTDGFNTTRSMVNVAIRGPLKILNTFPNDMDTNVSLKPYLFVIFGNHIKEGSLNKKSFLLLEKGINPVSGEVSYIADIMRATFVPEEQLKPNTSYTARIIAGVEDTAGNILETNYDWAFTTGLMP
ncbi:MAG: hypothetical protein A3G93_05190 [Nitrospinae bacterium RIFCSPLOWO2_12_FULL_45_22]|nr:MAG: hypothetical protein A3G93_05190 [Nitrospinae bacterium RIFCSPLOWO2_12_FULL_45_22]